MQIWKKLYQRFEDGEVMEVSEKRAGRERIKEGMRKEEGRPKTSRAPSEKKMQRRFRLHIMALQEIRRFQRSMGFLIYKLPFTWWVWQIMLELWDNLCIQATVLLALQEAAEAFGLSLFDDANWYTIHVKQMTNTQGYSIGIHDLGGYGKIPI